MGRILQGLGLQHRETTTTTYGSTIELLLSKAVERQIWGGAKGALAIPAVYSAASMITDTCSLAVLQEFHTDDDGYMVPVGEPGDITYRPHPGHTWREWLASVVWSMLTEDNAYLRLLAHDRNGHPRQAIQVPKDEVTVTWNSDLTEREYTWRNQRMVHGVDFLDLPYNRRVGELLGLGPLTAGEETYATALTVERATREFWANGGVPTLVINAPEYDLDATEAARLRSQFIASQQEFGPSVMSGGMSLESFAFSPTDSQLVEVRQFIVQETARLFRIPAPKLQASLPSGSAVVYQNADVLQREYVEGAIQPILETIEQALQLVRPTTRTLRFDLKPLLRPNPEVRYEGYAMGLTNGWLTVDEVRKDELLGPMPDDARPPAPTPAPTSEVPADA